MAHEKHEAIQPLPKKILVIKDLTYILPDDFSGSFEDALMSLVEYSKTHRKIAPATAPDNHEILFVTDGTERICGKFGVFELKDDEYVLVSSGK